MQLAASCTSSNHILQGHRNNNVRDLPKHQAMRIVQFAPMIPTMTCTLVYQTATKISKRRRVSSRSSMCDNVRWCVSRAAIWQPHQTILANCFHLLTQHARCQLCTCFTYTQFALDSRRESLSCWHQFQTMGNWIKGKRNTTPGMLAVSMHCMLTPPQNTWEYPATNINCIPRVASVQRWFWCKGNIKHLFF